jgi:hypothetical protein
LGIYTQTQTQNTNIFEPKIQTQNQKFINPKLFGFIKFLGFGKTWKYLYPNPKPKNFYIQIQNPNSKPKTQKFLYPNPKPKIIYFIYLFIY